MKNINNIMKIMIVIVALIILAGIIMICVKGYNYDLLYSKSVRMNIYLTKDSIFFSFWVFWKCHLVDFHRVLILFFLNVFLDEL